MAVRTDLTVDWDISPRIIRVAAPSTELTLQDLLDTVRDLEDEIRGMAEPRLIDADGKAEVGTGRLTGITATLQNAQVQFEGRTTPAQTGSATAGSGGLTLIDSLATLQTNNVRRGSLLVNFDDQSVGEVRDVISETELGVFSLDGGGGSFTVTDAYAIFNVPTMDLLDGNLLAVDDADMSIDPVLPSFANQVVRTGDVSAVQIETGVSGLTAEESTALIQIRDLEESDWFFDKSTGLIHQYRRGTTVDLVPPKAMVGEQILNDTSATQP